MGRLRTLDAPPVGARGRSRPGRLALLDRYLLDVEAALFAGERSLVVDVGLGDDPAPTCELARALPASGRILGVDIDEERVAKARRLGIDARVGGFALPLLGDEEPVLVRVMNVLRQYLPEFAGEAERALGARLSDGGLVVEGSSDTAGHVLVAQLLRRRGLSLRREALLFTTDFRRGFAPQLFRDQLPQGLRHGAAAAPGGSVARFFERWAAAFERTREPGSEAATSFAAAAACLADAGSVAHGDGWLRWSLPEEEIA